MRLDRSITLNVVQPFRRAMARFQGWDTGVRRSSSWSIPVLMYHSISDDPETSVSPYYRVNTSPAVFQRHMQFLADQGYRTISLDEIVRRLSDPHLGIADSEPSVVITFDDGFRDFYTEAFPALQKHGFSATMFLATSFIKSPRSSFRNRECLTWSEVRELRKEGTHFGSHTVSHPKLVDLSWPEIERELRDSKAEAENQMQTPVSLFCYPYAFPQGNRFFVERLSSELRQQGYRCCATTRVGRTSDGDDAFGLRRLPMNSLDDCALLAAKLQGGYDWLAQPQSWMKWAKGMVV